MKSAVLVIFLVFLSACVSLPFASLPNPFSVLQPQQAAAAEGLALSLSASPQSIFTGSTATIFFDAQNKDAAVVRNVWLDVFDTGNLATAGNCRASSPALLPSQILGTRCAVTAPQSIIQKSQAETISARAGFRNVLAAVQTLDIMSEAAYRRESLAGNIKPRPRKYTYSDKNMQMDIEFSEDLPIVFREDKQYFAYFTIRNIGNGFADKITFGRNFLPVEQNSLRFSQFRTAMNSGDIVRSVIELFQSLQVPEEQAACTGVFCCRDFKTIYPTGRTFPRIACELRLPAGEQLVDYQILVPLVYDYEVRASAQITVTR